MCDGRGGALSIRGRRGRGRKKRERARLERESLFSLHSSLRRFPSSPSPLPLSRLQQSLSAAYWSAHGVREREERDRKERPNVGAIENGHRGASTGIDRAEGISLSALSSSPLLSCSSYLLLLIRSSGSLPGEAGATALSLAHRIEWTEGNGRESFAFFCCRCEGTRKVDASSFFLLSSSSSLLAPCASEAPPVAGRRSALGGDAARGRKRKEAGERPGGGGGERNVTGS